MATRKVTQLAPGSTRLDSNRRANTGRNVGSIMTVVRAAGPGLYWLNRRLNAYHGEGGGKAMYNASAIVLHESERSSLLLKPVGHASMIGPGPDHSSISLPSPLEPLP